VKSKTDYEHPDSFDPRQVPPGERVAYVNRIADRAGADNACEFYEAATEAFKELSHAILRIGGLALRRAGQRAFDESALMLADEWSDEQARVVHAWLVMNARTIESLIEATDRATYFAPLIADASRLCSVGTPAQWPRLRQCAKLLGVQANQAALVGDWLAAYGWNARIYRIADHLYQGPSPLQRTLGMSVERLAANQLFSFLSRYALSDPAPLLARLAQQEVRACPDEVIAQAKSLVALDYIEAFFEWAADPQRDPKFGQFVGFLINPAAGMPRGLLRSAFASVEDFRAALLKSSVESAWQARLEHDAIYAGWEARPFAQAWREVKQFRAALAAIGERAPVQKVLDASWEPGRDRYSRAVARTRRNAAAVAVAALHYQHLRGRLPPSLDDLRQPGVVFDATDFFSGEPLRYHPADDGQSFVLYSVGPAQKDYGGTPGRLPPGVADFVYWPRLPECAKGS
jgi:hypothetical protein